MKLIKVTPAMIEACAAEMVKEDWLSPEWASTKEKCDCCGSILYNADQDGGENVRNAIHNFLTEALRAEA